MVDLKVYEVMLYAINPGGNDGGIGVPFRENVAEFFSVSEASAEGVEDKGKVFMDMQYIPTCVIWDFLFCDNPLIGPFHVPGKDEEGNTVDEEGNLILIDAYVCPDEDPSHDLSDISVDNLPNPNWSIAEPNCPTEYYPAGNNLPEDEGGDAIPSRFYLTSLKKVYSSPDCVTDGCSVKEKVQYEACYTINDDLETYTEHDVSESKCEDNQL